MGRAVFDAFQTARMVYEEVDDALNQSLTRLIFDGPEDDLTLTENAQPALMATSLAVARVIEAEGGARIADFASFVAGHSLGEYSALAAAGALSLPDAARLLKRRGQAMQSAVPVGDGAMVAILGLDLETVHDIAEEAAGDQVCDLANDNAPGQAVLSGDAAAVERATELAKQKGAKRALPLSVSAPFHSALLAPAAAQMREALTEIEIQKPAPPLVANVTADAQDEPDIIRALLVEQVTARVRWRESVVYMKDHDVDLLVEVGAGKVLGNLARRIDREVVGRSVETPDEIEALLKTI